MWFYLVIAALVVIGLVGGVAGAGIFTIVLLPIAVIVLVAGIAYRAMGQVGAPLGGDAPPLPHSLPDDPARVSASPEDLADARRAQQ
jgi:hypothetical protein